MAENKHGSLGSRGASNDDGSHDAGPNGAGALDGPVEAYEEDWYRSLRALAERQQELAERERDRPEDARDQTAPEKGPEAAVQAFALTPTADPEPAAADLADVPEDPSTGGIAPVIPPIDDPTPVEPVEPTPSEDHVATAETALEQQAADAAADGRAPQTTDAWPADAEPGPSATGVDVGDATPVEAPEPPDAWEPEAAERPTLERFAALELGALATGEPEVDVSPFEPPGPSLASADPRERQRALLELATQDLSDLEAEAVAALLFDPDAEVRLQALRTLGHRPERIEDASLAQALQDPSDDVRAAAVELAVRRGPHDLAPLVPLLAARTWPLTHRTVLERLPEVVASSDVDDDMLGRMLDAIGQMEPGPSEDERPAMSRLAHALGIPRILGCLDAPDVRRLGAARLLADDRSPQVLRTLASRGGDALEEVRRVAARAIAELGEAQAQAEPAPATQAANDEQDMEEESVRIGSLARALHDEDGTVRHLALSGLAGMDRSALVAWVHDTIRGGDASQLALAASTAKVLRLVEGAADILDAAAELPADARHNLVEALTSFVMPPEQLVSLLAQVREPVRAEAIRMLWRVGGAPLLPHLRAYLDDPSDHVRTSVLEAFGESGDGAAAEVAQAVLEHDLSPHVRARAVRVLADANGAPPMATVVRALSDPDPEVRAIAIESLPDTGDAEAVDVLVSSLSDPDERVRKAAAKRLASRGDDPELVWSALRMAPAAGRGEIIGSFELARPGSLTHVALKRLLSPEEEERVLAVEVAGWGESPGCVEGAIQALQDPAAPVRRAAAAALGRLREPAAAKALGKALGDPDPQVRVGVVRALGVIDDEGVLGFLVSALNDPDPRVREVTSQVLTEWSSPAVAKRLAGVLAVPSLREAATDLLTRIGPPAVELLIEVLMQHNPAVAPTVGQLLQRIAEPSGFVSRLEAVEPERRLRGLEALGAIGGAQAADALLRSVSDPDERIRVRAAQLLADLRDPRAREVLAGLAQDPVPGVVAAAQEALSRLGADGDRAA